MSLFRGVLFDKDGTLLDFNATWGPVGQSAARHVAGGDESLALHLLELGGFNADSGGAAPGSLLAAGTTAELAESWVPHLPSYDVASLTDALDRIFASSGVEGAVAVTDLESLFARLKGRNLALGIATSDSEAALSATVERFGLAAHLDFLAGYDSGHGIKPGPGMALAFCRQLGLIPKQAVMVGDNTHDLEMGRAAGFGLLVGVLTGTGTPEVLEPLADHVIGSIDELEGLL